MCTAWLARLLLHLCRAGGFTCLPGRNTSGQLIHLSRQGPGFSLAIAYVAHWQAAHINRLQLGQMLKAIDSHISLYPTGIEDEFIFIGRLDNLAMSFCSLVREGAPL